MKSKWPGWCPLPAEKALFNFFRVSLDGLVQKQFWTVVWVFQCEGNAEIQKYSRVKRADCLVFRVVKDKKKAMPKWVGHIYLHRATIDSQRGNKRVCKDKSKMILLINKHFFHNDLMRKNNVKIMEKNKKEQEKTNVVYVACDSSETHGPESLSMSVR